MEKLGMRLVRVVRRAIGKYPLPGADQGEVVYEIASAARPVG